MIFLQHLVVYIIKGDFMKKYVLKIEEESFIGLSEDMMKTMKLKSGDEVNVLYNANRLMISKFGPECMVCGESENLCEMGNKKFLCPKCIAALNKSVNKK